MQIKNRFLKIKNFKFVGLFVGVGLLSIGLLSAESNTTLTTSNKNSHDSNQNSTTQSSSLLTNSAETLESVEKIETFVVQIKNSFPDVSSSTKKIVILEDLEQEKESAYSSTVSKEVVLYLLGFKWLWGIFTGYRSTFVTPAWNEMQKVKSQLSIAQQQLDATKTLIVEAAEKIKKTLKNVIGNSENVRLSLAAQRAKTKLELIKHQMEYLIKRLYDEARHELVFQKSATLGRKSEYYNSSYVSNFGGSNSEVGIESRTETGLDTVTRQIWEKAEVERLMQNRKEFKEEVERARADFENTSKLEEYVQLLQEAILSLKIKLKKEKQY